MKIHWRDARTTAVTMSAPISWGTTYITVTELLPADRPLLIAAARVVVAGLALTIVARVRPRTTSAGGGGRSIAHTATLALFNFVLFFPLLIVAVYRMPGGVAASFGGTQPLLVAGVSWVVARRRPSGGQIGIALVAAIGVALVVVRPGASFDPVGVAAALGANLSFSLGVVLSKRFPPADDRVRDTGRQLLISAAVIVPVTTWAEGAPPHLSAANLVGFTYLGLVATAAAFVVWFRGISRLPTASPPLLGLAAPLTGALLGWWLLDESLSRLQLVGFVLVVAAVASAATRSGAPARPARFAGDDKRLVDHGRPVPG